MIIVRQEDVLEIVRNNPYCTTKEIARHLDSEFDTRPHNERVSLPEKIRLRLYALRKFGIVEPVPNTRPQQWREVGCEIAKDIEPYVSLRAKCKEVGMSYSTVGMRIKRGWSVEKALSTPVRKL